MQPPFFKPIFSHVKQQGPLGLHHSLHLQPPQPKVGYMTVFSYFYFIFCPRSMCIGGPVSLLLGFVQYFNIHFNHRIRIELEDKAKVAASVWRTESLPRKLFCLGLFGTNGWVQPFISNRPAEFDRLFQTDQLSSTVCGAKQLAWQGFMSLKQTRQPLPCLLIQSFFYVWCGLYRLKK